MSQQKSNTQQPKIDLISTLHLLCANADVNVKFVLQTTITEIERLQNEIHRLNKRLDFLTNTEQNEPKPT